MSILRSLRPVMIAAAVAIPAFAVASVVQDDSAPVVEYELESPSHDNARDCMNRITRAVTSRVDAVVRCTANNRGRLRNCELVEPTEEAQRYARTFFCLGEAHRLRSDNLPALQGEVIEIGLTIG